MMTLNGRVLLGSVIIAAAALSSVGSAQTIVKLNDSLYTTNQIDSFATTGAEMTGMEVWVNFATSGWKSSTWASTGATSGAASVAGFFEIDVDGDTFSSTWQLDNLTSRTANDSILGFYLKGEKGKTVFDTTSPNTGTTGSSSGADFQWLGGNPTATGITATYSHPVQLSGSSPVGDIFETVIVDLTAGQGLAGGLNLQFRQDTDNASPSLDPVVPEPASMLALGVGLVTIMRRRKKGSPKS